MPRIPKNEQRILTALHAQQNDKIAGLLLEKAPPLRRAVATSLLSKEEIDPRLEELIMKFDRQATPQQEGIAQQWIKKPQCPANNLLGIVQLSSKHRDAAAARLLEAEKAKGDPSRTNIGLLCEIMEWSPPHREKAAALIAADMKELSQEQTLFAAKTLMWSQEVETRAAVCRKCIPAFFHLAQSNTRKLQEAGRKLLSWVVFWAKDDVHEMHRNFLNMACTPDDGYIFTMIETVYEFG